MEEATPTSTEPPAQRTRAARGSAKSLLHEAAARLLADATLDDLTAFVTVGRLAAEAGVSNGAIYAAYKPTDGLDGRSRSAPQVAVREMFMSFLGTIDGMALEVIGAIERFVQQGTADREIIETLADIAGRSVEASGRGETTWDYTHLWIAAAVSLNDVAVREGVAVTYRQIEQAYESMVDVFLDLTDRVLVDGVSTLQLAQMLIDAADAGALRVRLHPESEPGIASRLIVAVFTAVTRRRSDHEDDLLRHLANPGRCATADERDRIAESVRRIVERSGWQEVTLVRAGNMALVDRSVLPSVAPTRHHLAAFLWSDVVESIERRAHNRAALGPEVQLVELVNDVADAACSRRDLVASLLQARLYDGRRESDGIEAQEDPIVEILAGLLIELAYGEVGLRRVAARTAVDALLVAAATSDATADELASVLIRGLGPDSPGTVGGAPYDS